MVGIIVFLYRLVCSIILIIVDVVLSLILFLITSKYDSDEVKWSPYKYWMFTKRYLGDDDKKKDNNKRSPFYRDDIDF